MQGATGMQSALGWMGPVEGGAAGLPGLPGGPGPNAPPHGLPQPGDRPPPQKKEKRPPGFKKSTQTRIQQCNTKLTDIKCWQQKVSDSPLQLICDDLCLFDIKVRPKKQCKQQSGGHLPRVMCPL